MFKALLKKQFSSVAYSLLKGGKSKGKGKGNTILMAVLLVYVCGVVGYMIYSTMNMMCAPLISASLDWLYFLYATIMTTALSVLVSLFMVQSSLYEAKDNELVLSLPIPPKDILLCRIIPLYVQNLFFSALVIIPSYIVYSNVVGLNGTQIVAAIVLTLLVPLFNLAICCILGYILAEITSRMRKKNVFQTILSILFLAVYFYFYSQAQRFIQNLITGSSAIAQKARTSLYVFCKAGEGATGNVKSLLIFVAITVALFAIVYVVLSKTYIKVVTRKRGAAKIAYKEKTLKVSTASKAILKKESKRFFGSTVYLMNTGLGTLFLVALTVISIVKSNWLVSTMNEIYPIEGFLPMLATFAVSMICVTNVVSAPSISLEGKNLWIVQSLPVSPFTVLLQKLKLHVLVTAPAALVCSVVLAIVFRASVSETIFMIVIPLLAVYFSGLFGLFCNINKPNFKWNSETEAVKQSMSVMLTMFGSWGFLILFVLMYVLIGEKISSTALMSIVSIVMLAVDALLYNYLKTKGAKKFAYMG